MSRAGVLIVLGVLTILTPFSGLPVAIRSFLAVIFGVCIAGIGISLRMPEPHKPQTVLETPSPEPHTPQGVSPI